MGFGPLGPRAAVARPAADADAYGGVDTWFQNCSAAGASDGTVPTSSWFNWWIGMWKYAATQAGVTVTNDQTIDTHIWSIIQNAITARLAAGSSTQGVGSFL